MRELKNSTIAEIVPFYGPGERMPCQGLLPGEQACGKPAEFRLLIFCPRHHNGGIGIFLCAQCIAPQAGVRRIRKRERPAEHAATYADVLRGC